MDRISGPNFVMVGGVRMWADRNQATGIPGTFGNALWMNGVQETLLAVVQAAGLVPTDADNTQLLQAIRFLINSLPGSPGINGWQQLPGGDILQWGIGVTVSGNQDFIGYPTSFTQNLYACLVNEGHAATWGSPPQPSIYGTTRLSGAASLTGFSVSCVSVVNGSGNNSFAAGAGFSFMAIGK